jgi:hypothetical protein
VFGPEDNLEARVSALESRISLVRADAALLGFWPAARITEFLEGIVSVLVQPFSAGARLSIGLAFTLLRFPLAGLFAPAIVAQ